MIKKLLKIKLKSKMRKNFSIFQKIDNSNKNFSTTINNNVTFILKIINVVIHYSTCKLQR